MAITLQTIKNEIVKSGTSKGKFLFFKEGETVRVRFLSDFEDGMEIPFHSNYQLGVNVPCQEVFGKHCEYCEDEDLKTKNKYAWSVYDYDAKEVKIIMEAVNNCSPIPVLTDFFEKYGTITDRDYEIKQLGKGVNKTFSIIPLEKRKFRGGAKVKPLSEQAILKYVNKAYPADNSEDLDDEEETKKGRKKTKTKTKTKTKVEEPEPEDDDWGEEEAEETNYESMSAKDLYDLCRERELDCKPRKTKEYYIDLLEEDDEESEDDGWDDEEDDDDGWDD